jgi:hypothetical protein
LGGGQQIPSEPFAQFLEQLIKSIANILKDFEL